MENKEKILQKILKLREMTIENGCSESEALVASEKMLKIMTEYNISLNELEVEEKEYEENHIETGKAKQNDLSYILNSISKFTDTYIWIKRKYDHNLGKRTIKYAIFGQPQDVQFAIFIYKLIEKSIDFEVERFKKTPEYLDSNLHGRLKLRSFRLGIVSRLSKRLIDMKDNLKKEYEEKGIILLSDYQKIEKIWEETYNIKLNRNNNRTNSVDYKSFLEGQKASENINISKPLESENKIQRSLN